MLVAAAEPGPLGSSEEVKEAWIAAAWALMGMLLSSAATWARHSRTLLLMVSCEPTMVFLIGLMVSTEHVSTRLLYAAHVCKS